MSMSYEMVTPSKEPPTAKDAEANDDINVFVEGLAGREKFPPDAIGAFDMMLMRWVNGNDDEEELTDAKHKALEAPAFAGMIHTCFWAILSICCQWVAVFLLTMFSNAHSADRFQELNNAVFTPDQIRQNLNLINATEMLTHALAQNPIVPLNSTTMGKNVIAFCEKDTTVPGALELFLFIMGSAFVAKLSKRTRSIYTRTMQVLSDDDDDVPEDANYWQKNPLDSTGKERLIIYESRLSKVLGLLLVGFPEMLTTCYVYFVGAQMLCTTPTLIKVVMKCLGISLVGKLPKTFFSFFVEETIQKKTKKVFIAFKKNKLKDHWNNRLFLGPILKVLIVVFFTWLFAHVQWRDANTLRRACYGYRRAFLLPECRESWPCGQMFLGHIYFSG